ncbi:MAG: glycosyltransferase family 2 protein [Propionibacterium sp.]|nr:glycosyltransferase family 2 protein [Propionibacterium sp.]
MSVSVVMPVRNEELHLTAAVERVLAQEFDGELEIIIAVGPSRDDTLAIAHSLAAGDERISVVDNPSGFTPAGLNRAIEHASHDVIVRVDGHGELSPGYIARAVALLEETGAANVGGVMDAVGRTPFERAVAASYNSPYGLGGGGFHHKDTPAGPADTVFLGVFRRHALEDVGGFDETMHRAQDWELNYRLRRAGHLIYFCPDLHVTYRPRSTYRALAKQFFLTGNWRREVVRRHPETASLRYLAPPVAVILGFGGLGAGIVGLLLRFRWAGLLLVAPTVYCLFILLATVKIPADPAAKLRLPFVLAVMHACWGVGFLRGPIP